MCRHTITNIPITGNTSEFDGGGMWIGNTVYLTLTNVTISGNTAERDGGGMYSALAGFLKLNKSIIRTNSQYAIYIDTYY